MSIDLSKYFNYYLCLTFGDAAIRLNGSGSDSANIFNNDLGTFQNVRIAYTDPVINGGGTIGDTTVIAAQVTAINASTGIEGRNLFVPASGGTAPNAYNATDAANVPDLLFTEVPVARGGLNNNYLLGLGQVALSATPAPKVVQALTYDPGLPNITPIAALPALGVLGLLVCTATGALASTLAGTMWIVQNQGTVFVPALLGGTVGQAVYYDATGTVTLTALGNVQFGTISFQDVGGAYVEINVNAFA